MPELSDRRLNVEEQYFRRKERELIERLRKKAEREAERKGLAEAVGLENQEILDILQEMGFDHATVVLLFLVPLLEVAWSDGAISDQERDLIRRAAQAHGVAEGTPAHARLAQWLESKPDATLFKRALKVIRDITAFQSDEAWRTTGRKLVEGCERVAAASGGFLGLGSKISPKERAVLRRVASEIESAHAKAADRVASKLRH